MKKFLRILIPCVAVCAILGAACHVYAEVSDVGTDNIVVVLDASGSMNEPMRGSGSTKMTAAINALIQVMDLVPEGTNVGLLAFGRNIQGGGEWLFPLGPMDKQKFRAAVLALAPGGQTPLGQYLKKAADRLLEQRKQQRDYGTYRLLVVTDGEATDPRLLESYLPDVLGRGIIIDAIGVAMPRNHTLARSVHRYRRADDAQALEKAISETVAEIGAAKDDTTAEADFALIAALPDEFPQEILNTLTRSDNRPIQMRSQSPQARRSSSSKSQATPGASRTRTTSSQTYITYIIVIVFALSVLLKIMKAAARR